MRHPLLACALAAALALTGCGDDTADSTQPAPDAAAVDVVRLAAETTTDAETAKVAMTSTTTIGDRTVSFEADGAFDFAGRTGTLSMQLPDNLGGRIDQIVTPERVYVRGVPGTGEGWVSVDLGQASRLGAFSANSDPTQLLDYLRGLADDVRADGTADVRGVRTTKYVGTVDVQKVAAEMPAGVRDQFERAMAALSSTTFPIEAYVDDEQRVRRVVTSFTSLEAGDAGELSSSVTFDLYDFGTEVQVTVPPASEVRDGTDLFGGTGSAG